MAAEATKQFTKSIEIDPNYANAYHLRSFLHFSQGRHSGCIKDSIRVVELEPKHKGVRTRRRARGVCARARVCVRVPLRDVSDGSETSH